LPENDPASEPDGVERHVAGIWLGDATLDGFDTLVIDRRPALRLRHIGPFERIDDTGLALYRHVVERDLALADAPPLHHHLDEPEEVPPERLRTDLYLMLADAPEGGRT
jgi:hypothetical protein